jgi:hypothetical protein
MIPRPELVIVYAVGRTSHARQVKCDDAVKKGYTDLGVGRGPKTPTRKKSLLRKLEKAKVNIEL